MRADHRASRGHTADDADGRSREAATATRRAARGRCGSGRRSRARPGRAACGGRPNGFNTVGDANPKEENANFIMSWYNPMNAAPFGRTNMRTKAPRRAEWAQKWLP